MRKSNYEDRKRSSDKSNKINKKKYGWVPDLPDARDHTFDVPLSAAPLKLPTSCDLRSLCPPMWDQLNLGSCVGHGVGALLAFINKKQYGTTFMPSRLMIYWMARQLIGTVSYDSGAYLRDAMKQVNKFGASIESLWTYTPSKYRLRPPAAAYKNALTHRSIGYARINNTNINALKTALAINRVPIVMGFTVYESFESDVVTNTGVVPMPSMDESVLGGHAICIVGFSDADSRFICRNSWGTGWGINGTGYFSMPYAYITNTNLCEDFWIITGMNG